MLQIMIELMAVIAEKNDINKMTPSNLATATNGIMASMMNVMNVGAVSEINKCVTYMIENSKSTCALLETTIKAKNAVGDDSDSEYQSENELVPKSLNRFQAAVKAVTGVGTQRGRSDSGSSGSSVSSGENVEISSPSSNPSLYQRPQVPERELAGTPDNKMNHQVVDANLNMYAGKTIPLREAKQKFGAGSKTALDPTPKPKQPDTPSSTSSGTTHGLFPSGVGAHGDPNTTAPGPVKPVAPAPFDPAAARSKLKPTQK
jgi:hypothetical protein